MIIGTCGHKIDLEWFNSGNGNISVKENINDYAQNKISRSIAYCLVCPDCLVWYAKHNLILRNEDDERKYLQGL